ncbi:uncharacterized protein OCT59_029430 [Rhizophagus irregularis]|uniref:uncharacterized protein n=1 Tax=Rhizophagus irregularis TaxID=588596 RepID=UPI003317FABE|nr:hypothetical protein OCT59_029430 [Rhizophagus irregularis]
MPTQFFSKLSHNFIELLKDNEFYDITIEVNKDPNVKIFRAHTGILCYRSPYLKRYLTSNKKNNNVLAHVKLPNILPETFQIILKYIYGGIFSLDGKDTLDIFRVLAAADELLLQELVDYLQNYFIENKIEWMKQNFELTHRISFQSNSLSEIQKLCTNFMVKSPEKIFKSLDFTSLPEKSLVSLIKRDDLQMKEIEVWNHVLKWGLAQNQNLISDPDTWTDLLGSYMDPDSEPNSNNSSLPRDLKIDEIIDSKIINLNIASIISRWIDKVDINNKFAYLRELYLPYNFKLLLRGSQNGFSPKKFHELCNDKPNTVTFIKVTGTGEILGGYNPSIWKSSGNWGQSYYSFIFSFKNKNEFDKLILSHVKNMDKALYYPGWHGPSFGSSDLQLSVSIGGNKSNNFDYNICKQTYYEKRIRNTENLFYIEEYEVFQIIRN